MSAVLVLSRPVRPVSLARAVLDLGPLVVIPLVTLGLARLERLVASRC